jgi:ABC-type nitrate/sulfonate/bicarbonate transport system substrate-binding protein
MTRALTCWVAVLGVLAFAAPAAAQETVTVGIYAATSDAPLFIADKKGYFRDEGIAVKLTNFQSAAMMVPPLGTGQLDVGARAASRSGLSQTRRRRRWAMARPSSWCARTTSTADDTRASRTSRA